MRLVFQEPGNPLRVLEVGHYFGLSTCGLVHALRARASSFALTSLDAHIPDAWVMPPASVESFEKNRDAYFPDDRLTCLYERSQSIEAVPYDVVFYDGDHADEQLRFTRAVMASPEPRLFVFDDRDFPVPSECCRVLIEAGWRNESPPCSRSGADKRAPDTMTLGVFRR